MTSHLKKLVLYIIAFQALTASIFLTGNFAEANNIGQEESNTTHRRREFSLGANKSSGNTSNEQVIFKLFINRKTYGNEFTTMAESFYSTSQGRMDGQRHSGLVRYAFSFGQRKWYNFYKMEADHDRFANVDYRLVPSIGVGYWWSDTADLKVMAEIGAGLEHTDFRYSTDKTNKGVSVPRIMFERKIFTDSRISQETILHYPFQAFSGWRLRSETSFINLFNKHFSLHLNIIDYFNSKPPPDTKRHDILFITRLAYTFETKGLAGNN